MYFPNGKLIFFSGTEGRNNPESYWLPSGPAHPQLRRTSLYFAGNHSTLPRSLVFTNNWEKEWKEGSHFPFINPTIKNKTRFKTKISFLDSLRCLKTLSIPAGNLLLRFVINVNNVSCNLFALKLQDLSYQHLDLQQIWALAFLLEKGLLGQVVHHHWSRHHRCQRQNPHHCHCHLLQSHRHLHCFPWVLLGKKSPMLCREVRLILQSILFHYSNTCKWG